MPFWPSTILGNRIVKVDPRPGSLSTVMSPPIIWQNRLLIARPRPVPPYLLAVVDDAWENSWNSLPICSGVMPMPVGYRYRDPVVLRAVMRQCDYFVSDGAQPIVTAFDFALKLPSSPDVVFRHVRGG